MKNLAVLLSGQGTVCGAIYESTKNGKLAGEAKINLIVSTNEDTNAIHGRSAYIYLPWEDPDEWHIKMYELMDLFNIDLICLAGFIKKIQVWPEWENKILNTHPSLLPKFGGSGMYGSHVHKAVIESGEEETGCTIHVVTKEYDQGPILGQSKLKLSKISQDQRESPLIVSHLVKQLEYSLYPQVISDYLKEQYPKS